MVIEWALGLALMVSEWITGMFPEVEIPQWFIDLDGAVNTVFATLSGLSAWVDFVLLFGVLSTTAIVWVACLIIKALRAAAAHVPLVGGSG